MDDFSQRERKLLILLGISFLISIGLFFGNKFREEKKYSFMTEEQATEYSIEENSSAAPSLKEEKIYIHISGAVGNPGLLEIESNSRLIDAIEAAGGSLDDADLEQVNLSRKVHDEERIHIPKKGELTAPLTILPQENDQSASNKVNINLGNKEQLMELPGVGEKTAEKIINYREKTPFGKIEDLKEVPGIGDKKFEELKDRISV